MDNNPKNNDKFFKESYHRKHWEIFYNFFDQDLKMLDFGCGAGWGIKIGREKGYDIVGLDTIGIHPKRHDEFDGP